MLNGAEEAQLLMMERRGEERGGDSGGVEELSPGPFAIAYQLERSQSADYPQPIYRASKIITPRSCKLL
jgi:hypothetical protein